MSFPVKTQTSLTPNAGRLLRWFRRVVIVGLIFATVLLRIQSASASCGSYLYRNGKPVGDHAVPMDELNRHSAASPESDKTPVEVPVRRCSGPNCSGSPLPLTPVPAVPSNLIRGFDPAAVLESLLKIQPTRCAIQIPESERGARFEPSSVFRPPRA